MEVSQSCFEFLLIAMLEQLRDKVGAFKEIGVSVGQRLGERLVKDHEKEFSSESVDAMKFICKDVWSVLFRKQIDNLKTNHKGTYELYEDSPLWFMYTSPLKNSFKEEPIHNASLEFFSGVIAGVLDTLGYKSDVFGEFLEGNSCRFIVNII